MTHSRSYGQFCGLARALDHIGDRWTLLIVRELLIEPRTFSTLERTLLGISPNLLVDRLRGLVEDGLVERNDAPARSKAVIYRLTEAGVELEPAVFELIRWGARWMRAGSASDRVDPSWAALALRALLDNTAAPRTSDGVVQVDVEGTAVSIRLARGVRWVVVGAGDAPDAVVAITMRDVLALASGGFTLEQVDASIEGDPQLVATALQP